MILENRYGLSSEQVQRLVKDGYLSPVRLRNDEIRDKFAEFKRKCPQCNKADLFGQIAEVMRVSEATVEKAVYGKERP